VVNDSVGCGKFGQPLSNAIKFTEAGSVEVRVSESPQLILSVKDNGIGIAESDMEHIFEEFRQIDQTTTQAWWYWFGACDHQIVGKHDARSRLKSKLGQGSTFHVELPRYVREQVERRP